LKITITCILYTHYNNVSEFFVEETHGTTKLAALYHALMYLTANILQIKKQTFSNSLLNRYCEWIYDTYHIDYVKIRV